MIELALGALLLAAAIAWAAGVEWRGQNRRDAGLLAAFAASSGLGGLGLALL